jgi:hypothetical protein
MAIEPLPEITPPCEETEPTRSASGGSDSVRSDEAELPEELSEFSQRLASFGLGEAPDPLLTEARPPAKRRSRR